MRQSRRAATPDARCVMDGATRRRAFPLCHGTTTRFLCAGSRRQRRAPPRTPGIPPHPRHHGRFIAARFRRATGRRHVSFAPVRTTRRGATCDARPTAGRQHNRPHARARHPGDMNVAPTHMPDNHATHQSPHDAQTATTRRGATCDARPTAGRQRNRPHACVRHPGDMNVAPTFTPHLSHPARPAFRRHPGDMNVAPTCIPTFITRHHPARPATGVIIIYVSLRL